jgi:hypothetical protein
MRCCGSPTTCIAAELRAAAPGAPAGEVAARDVVNAVLFRAILEPLARGLGPLAETALGAVADELFVRRRR